MESITGKENLSRQMERCMLAYSRTENSLVEMLLYSFHFVILG
jgi:hypothetical protein